MPLSPGDKLGPYEILAPLGAGGMGEVYRAHDTRLRRDVAIKVSAERFAERFEKEARAIASLNHPNVCTLHDVGPNYLVMELVEGQTLAERIKQSAIPLDEALAIAHQIADALEAAHEKGITHRDLKPGNINIKPDGTVKVLDFGLAKIGGTPTAQSDNSPTLTVGPTQAGMILGTAAYMSPEQARGKEVDRRADIWAFGVVLYEMLTGQKLFEGDDLSETLASVIKEQPKLERAPTKVQRLLRSCLEKDPKQRLQAIGDWHLLLEDQGPSPEKAPATRRDWAVVTMLVVALGIALWAPWRAEKPVNRPLARLDVDLGADVSLPSTTGGVAISPDGTRLAYVSGTPTRLFTRRLDQPKATELPGTELASRPFFSPDGQWIGFVGVGRLNKISVEGGTVVPLTDIQNATFAGASWGEDGTILLSEGWTKGLLRIPAGGGPPETIAELGGGELALALPQLLPGGKAILFSAHTMPDVDKATIEVLTLIDRRRKIVARGGQSPRYLATSDGAGHLVYVNKAALFAVPFDLEKLETRGTAVPVLDDIANSTNFRSDQFGFSRRGTLVYRKASGRAPAMTVPQWTDPSGRMEPLRAKPAHYNYASLSPDGKRLALVITEDGSQDLWVYDSGRDAMTRLTFGGGFYSYPRWSPDGQYIVFGSHGKGIFQARADGSSQPAPLTQAKTAQFPWSFTADGRQLAYDDLGDGNWRIWTVTLEEQGGRLKAGKPEQIQSNSSELNPVISPDGRWMAYESSRPDGSGDGGLFVRAFPPSSREGGKWQISNAGGWAHWSRNGHELVYQSGSQMLAASYTVKGDTFVVEKPRVWIAKLGGTAWDLAPDGKKVLVIAQVESAEAPKQEHVAVFLENFFDYLRQRVPVGK